MLILEFELDFKTFFAMHTGTERVLQAEASTQRPLAEETNGAASQVAPSLQICFGVASWAKG